MKRAVVTGTGGQIGSDLAPALVQAGVEIRLLDYLKPELVAGHPAAGERDRKAHV